MTFETTFSPVLPVLEQVQVPVLAPEQEEQAAELRQVERPAAQAAVPSCNQPGRRSRRMREPI